MKIVAWIPNILTLGNLVFGCIAIQFAMLQDFRMAALMMLNGAILDFFDGFVARLLKVNGELGKQLDSLADVVTFGVAPGAIVFQYFCFLEKDAMLSEETNLLYPIIAYCALLIPVFSAVRLAVFNLDKSQSHSFKGLPTPANGLFFAFFCASLFKQPFSAPQTVYLADLTSNKLQYTAGAVNVQDQMLSADIAQFYLNKWVLVTLVVGFCLLMVSRIPLFALKFKSFGFKGNEIRYIFLTLALGMLIIFQFRAIPIIVLLYILLSLIVIPFNSKQTHEV